MLKHSQISRINNNLSRINNNCQIKINITFNNYILFCVSYIVYNVSGAYQPSHEIMLRFYSYYKQAIEGPCQQSKPAFWEVIKKAKWDAWTRLGNMSRTEAMNNYVEELKKVSVNFVD